jgi:leucyl/phenylalanyl-tRNA--protein transferase
MPVFYLSSDPLFSDPELAEPDGLLAVGGDLQLDRLVIAYSQGIFPWYSEGMPILWWSPDPRPVIYPDQLHVPRRLKRFLRKHPFRVTVDRDFYGVIEACATMNRGNTEGTWLLPEMIEAYENMHRHGYAHSVEVWKAGELVGGFYGVALGRVFFGESMFHRCSDAAKVGFVLFVRYLASLGFSMIDCQQTTAHMVRFGAREIPRWQFLAGIREGIRGCPLQTRFGRELLLQGDLADYSARDQAETGPGS